MLLGAALANDLAQSCSAIGRTTPSAGREHWHGGGGGAWQLHGFAAGAQVSEMVGSRQTPQSSAAGRANSERVARLFI